MKIAAFPLTDKIDVLENNHHFLRSISETINIFPLVYSNLGNGYGQMMVQKIVEWKTKEQTYFCLTSCAWTHVTNLFLFHFSTLI